MRKTRGSRRSLPLAFCLCIAALTVLWGPGAQLASASDPVWQVEEHWELVVAQPDAGTAGPQITCTISPLGSLAGQYATFDLNHRASPSFAAGGLHLHLWNGDTRLGTLSRHSGVLLATQGETISWKTVMSVEGGALIVDIDNGSSQTWGAFGSSILSSAATSLANLDEYSPDVSAENTGIGYASNRVTSLKLKKVVYRRQSGAVTEDDTVRVIHSVE